MHTVEAHPRSPEQLAEFDPADGAEPEKCGVRRLRGHSAGKPALAPRELLT